MGSVGKKVEAYEDFSSIEYDAWQKSKYVSEISQRFRDISNLQQWLASLTPDERSALQGYVDSTYEDINRWQYNIPWEEMSDYQKRDISDLYDAISKYELREGIVVNRETDFRIFGADEYEHMSVSDIKDFLKSTNGVMQNDGFMSFSTRPNGVAVEGGGLVIHMKVPPSVGAGAYIGSTFGLPHESEFLMNTNTIMRLDPNSVYRDEYGKIHISGEALGRSRAQTISPTYGKK